MRPEQEPFTRLELRLLGGLTLRGAGGPLSHRATQKRRLAILALLAMAPERRLTRDKLIAVLWSEARADEARHRLSVSIYDVRRGLGEDVLESHGDDLVLNASVVSSDADAFVAAVNREDWENAVRLYAGPFLDGFHLGGSEAFEEWLAAHRHRLMQLFERSLDGLATAREARGDIAGAVEALEQLTRVQPYSARIVERLVTLLWTCGERARARRSAQEFRERVRDDLGIEPDAELEALLRRLHDAGQQPGDAASGNAGAAQPARAPLSARQYGSDAPAAAPPTGVSSPPSGDPAGQRQPPRRERWRATRHLTALAGLLILASAVLAYRAQSRPQPAPREHVVAVLPFPVHGSTELQYLREGMVDLLATSLDGAGKLRAILPGVVIGSVADQRQPAIDLESAQMLAARLNADLLVLGSVHVHGAELRLSAAAWSREEGRTVAEATVQGSTSELLPLVDALAAELLAGLHVGAGERLSQVAARTTRSLAALKSYLSGEQLFRGGRFAEAVEAFGIAAAADSTFALAHYRLALSMLWADLPDTLPFHAQARALRHSDHLPFRDRMLIRAFVAWREGQAVEAERMYRSIVAMYPDDVEAWHQLGETLFHYNPLRGRLLVEAREPFARALELDPRHWGARWHLALLAASERRVDEFEQHASALLARRAEGAEALQLQVLRAAVRRDTTAFSQLVPLLRRSSDLHLTEILWRTAVHGGDLGIAERVARLLASPERGTYPRATGYEALVYLALAQERWEDAERALARLAQFDVPNLGAAQLLAICHPERTGSLPLRDGWSPTTAASSTEGAVGSYIRGVIAAEMGSIGAAHEWSARLAQNVDPDTALRRSLHFALEARLAFLAGDYERAVALADAGRLPHWFGFSSGNPVLSAPHDRFLLAEALLALGRVEEAAGWYASIGDYSLHDLPFRASAQRRLAELREHDLGQVRARSRDSDSPPPTSGAGRRDSAASGALTGR